MPDGYRVLENGDYRISEASDSRITERFDDAHTDLNATGSLSALAISTAFAFTDAIGGEGYIGSTPLLTVRGLTNLQSTGNITADGTRTTFGEFSLSASGTLVNDPQIGKFASADLQGSSSFASDATVERYEVSCVASSTLAASADKKLFGFADLQTIGTHLFAGDRFIGHTHNFSGDGTVYAEGLVTRPASTNLNATGSISTVATYTASGVTGLTGTGSISAIGGIDYIGATSLNGEGNFIGGFITGDLQMKGLSNLNSTGSLSVTDTLIPFSSDIYIKKNGFWKTTTNLYVKHNGSWVEPHMIYKKVSGSWQRVH
jgi:hypothetical protein